MLLRPPVEEDWPEIRRLAYETLCEVAKPPSQETWLDNRRAFPSRGKQHHFVAVIDDRIEGYAAAERHLFAPAGEYRLFIVVPPLHRETIGRAMLEKLRDYLVKRRARRARMMEYEVDCNFIAFLQAMGFAFAKSFKLEGEPIVELVMASPFQSLAAS